jgi:hypothetical protein
LLERFEHQVATGAEQRDGGGKGDKQGSHTRNSIWDEMESKRSEFGPIARRKGVDLRFGRLSNSRIAF